MDVVALIDAHPEVVAVVVLITGAFLAQLLRALMARSFGIIDAWMARNATSEVGLITPALIRTSKAFVFWVVIAIAVVVALRVLGVDIFAGALNELLRLLPRLVIALALVGAGHLLGLLTQVLIARLSESIQPDSVFPRIAHAVILVIAVVIGLQQLGIDLTFATQLVIVVLSIGFGGLALAFALGARNHVANLIGRSELLRYAVGERIRIDGIEGTIIDIYATGVELATSEGVVVVPAGRFSSASVLKITEVDDAG